MFIRPSVFFARQRPDELDGVRSLYKAASWELATLFRCVSTFDIAVSDVSSRTMWMREYLEDYRINNRRHSKGEGKGALKGQSHHDRTRLSSSRERHQRRAFTRSRPRRSSPRSHCERSRTPLRRGASEKEWEKDQRGAQPDHSEKNKKKATCKEYDEGGCVFHGPCPKGLLHRCWKMWKRWARCRQMLESLGTARGCGDFVDRNTRLCSELYFEDCARWVTSVQIVFVFDESAGTESPVVAGAMCIIPPRTSLRAHVSVSEEIDPQRHIELAKMHTIPCCPPRHSTTPLSLHVSCCCRLVSMWSVGVVRFCWKFRSCGCSLKKILWSGGKHYLHMGNTCTVIDHIHVPLLLRLGNAIGYPNIQGLLDDVTNGFHS